LGSLIRFTTSFAAHAAGLLLVLAALMMFSMVITRYVFAWSDPSVEIIARYLMIWATFVGLAAAVRTDSEIRFTLVEMLLPPRARKVFRVVGRVVAAALVAVLVYSGIELVRETMDFNEVMPTALRWPIWIFNAAVPVGAAFLVVQVLAQAVAIWRDEPAAQVAAEQHF
jgi:C4-dicarboxylate transporter, DctQ subunit